MKTSSYITLLKFVLVAVAVVIVINHMAYMTQEIHQINENISKLVEVFED